MRRRLYFLLPNVEMTKEIFDELLLARINDSNIRTLAKEGTSLEGLNEAGFFQKSDVVHGWEMGLIIGGATGLLASAAAYFIYATTLDPFMMVLIITLAGAVIGAWSSSMIAVDVPNSQLSAFKDQIDHGEILLMIDVPKERVEEITRMIKAKHPEADSHGVEPLIPAFP